MGLLDGRVALVTGAGRGIGNSIARRFAAEGARVAVHYNSSPTAIQFADEIGGFAVKADLRKAEEAGALVDAVIGKYGKVDILVNNAASFTHGKTFAEDRWGSYLDEIDGVLGVTFHVTHAIVPYMKSQNHGRIINFGAALLWRPIADYGPHATAKSAVVGLTGVLVRELGPFGITINLIHPGMTLTDFSNSLPEQSRAKVAELTPLRRLADGDDVSKVALFFASDLGGFVTGAGLAPDGGLAVL